MNNDTSAVSKTDIEQLKTLHASIVAERAERLARINVLNEQLATIGTKRGKNKENKVIVSNNVEVTKIAA
jgi:hypothetical protein